MCRIRKSENTIMFMKIKMFERCEIFSFYFFFSFLGNIVYTFYWHLKKNKCRYFFIPAVSDATIFIIHFCYKRISPFDGDKWLKLAAVINTLWSCPRQNVLIRSMRKSDLHSYQILLRNYNLWRHLSAISLDKW